MVVVQSPMKRVSLILGALSTGSLPLGQTADTSIDVIDEFSSSQDTPPPWSLVDSQVAISTKLDIDQGTAGENNNTIHLTDYSVILDPDGKSSDELTHHETVHELSDEQLQNDQVSSPRTNPLTSNSADQQQGQPQQQQKSVHDNELSQHQPIPIQQQQISGSTELPEQSHKSTATINSNNKSILEQSTALDIQSTPIANNNNLSLNLHQTPSPTQDVPKSDVAPLETPDNVDTETSKSKNNDIGALFEMMGELTETTKSITSSTNLIPSLQTNLETLTAQVAAVESKLSSELANLSARVLTNEESIEDLKKSVDTEKKYVTTHVKPIIKKLEKGNLIDSLSADMSSKISQNSADLAQLKLAFENQQAASLNDTVGYSLSEEEMKTISGYVVNELSNDEAFPSRLSKIQTDITGLRKADSDATERIRTIELQLNQLRTTDGKMTANNNSANNSNINNSNGNPKFYQKYPPAEHETLDHELLIIGDSNTTQIDMRKMAHNQSRKRFTCYTIPQAMHFLNTATINRQPEKVMFHLGTNDVVKGTGEQLKHAFDELFTRARECFPEARIYMSSIFVRKDKKDPINKLIKEMNVYLESFCDRTAFYTFISNGNITHKDMKDPRHVNPGGFYMFICNFRRVMFNEILPQRRSGR